MTALAIKDLPGFELSEIEMSDAAQGKNTYTCDTLQKLKIADPEAAYYFILGADSLYAIEKWEKPALIFQTCTILAAVRREASETSQATMELLSAQAQYLREKYHASVEILEFAGIDISSTKIREKLRKGESLRGLLPEAVERYIIAERLYIA